MNRLGRFSNREVLGNWKGWRLHGLLLRRKGKGTSAEHLLGRARVNECNLTTLLECRYHHHSCSVDKEPILKGDNSIFMVQTRKQNDLADLGSDPCLTWAWDDVPKTQAGQLFSVLGQPVSILGLADHTVSVPTAPFHPASWEQGQMLCTTNCVWLCFNKALGKQAAGLDLVHGQRFANPLP